MRTEHAAAVLILISTEPIKRRFWAHVSKAGPTPAHAPELGPCWQWTGPVSGTYGNFSLWVPILKVVKSLVAHRVAWAMWFGRWPSKHLLHECDNRLCVRGSHLRHGTAKENTADMDTRKRRGKGYRKERGIGSEHGRAKLTELIVIAVRERVAAGENISSLAREFGVAPAAIRQAVERKTWRHVL